MADDDLKRFVETALAQGATKPEIEAALSAAGWPADQIGDALEAYADVGFRVPVPAPSRQMSAREAFVYLLLFLALYISAFNVGGLLFSFVDLAFRDPLGPALATIHESIRWSIAAVVVAYPAFLYLSIKTAREVRREPIRRSSPVRRWLTHLTLFVAAAVIAGDAIALVYRLLSGDLSTQIALKMITIGVIAGAAFVYYLDYSKAPEGVHRLDPAKADGP